jgi:nucleoside-diphosphate-sugar epimerase
MDNETILITGASGFMGRALVARFLKEYPKTKLVLLSRTSRFDDLAHESRVIPVIGDINNVELLVYVLKTHAVSVVYHLASEAIISEYTKNPRQAYLDTVYGVTSLLEAVRTSAVPVKKVIVSTSYKVYGKAEPPYNEETHFLPGNTYETAKACQDFIAQDYHRTFGVPVVIFRTVNVYGPGDRNTSRLIPRSFSNVYYGKSPVVYSSFRDSLREFIYIDDLIDAMLLLQEKASPGDIYCIGGEQHTIYEVAETICEVAGYKGGVEITETKNVPETKEHALDSSKLITLGWRKKTSLKAGLKATGEFYKDFLQQS